MTSLSSEPSVHKMIPKKFQKDRRSICLISTMSEVPPFIRRDKNMLIEKLFSFGRNESTLGKTQTTSRKSIMESLECRRLMSGSGILEWPSSSQNILSVGGTTLSASPTGTDSTESGWADSGGGLNRFEFEASYDSTVQNTDVRTTPDGAVPANPFGVFAVYDSNAYKGQSGWFEVGGTSAGVPQWASLIAIADQTGAANEAGNLSPIQVYRFRSRRCGKSIAEFFLLIQLCCRISRNCKFAGIEWEVCC
jgi:hypothetical protein